MGSEGPSAERPLQVACKQINQGADVAAKSSERQVVAERITVGLIPKVVKELDDLQWRTGMSKTDLVNRAVSLYFFIDKHLACGEELRLYDPKNQQDQRVHLL
jgi:hypothetical protein